MFLTPEELVELTHRTRYGAQVRMLRAMGIEHRQRADGSVVVVRAHVEQLLGVVQGSIKTEPEAELGEF